MDLKNLREQIFRHLDGVVTIPIALSLHQKGILDEISNHDQLDLDLINEKFNANKGYLNVALRSLASQGFINYEVNNSTQKVLISKNQKTSEFIDNLHWYYLVEELTKSYDVEEFMGKEADGNHKVFKILKEFVDKESSVGHANEITLQMIKHTEGYLMSPMIVKLGMSGMFHKYFMESSFSADEFHQQPEVFDKILRFFANRGWFNQLNGHYQFTEKGLYYAKRASSYGVTVSYLPIFLNINEFLFGEPNQLRESNLDTDEIHVDRVMNVWGSGGAHATYFKVLDEFIIEIFNQPLELQPKGILDMGCGNGALLQHLYETIERSTLRGKHLDDYPLFLVGADYNQAALKITRTNLISNDIWAKVIWGDIGNPDLLAEDLKKNYNIELEDLLNMRTFLDHNRVWEDPGDTANLISESTGAFAHRGELITNNKVELSLQKHLEKWKPYVSKNGLILIELHTVAPDITAKNIGKIPATAYDATHGFSDQYIVEVDVFLKAAKAAGLNLDESLYRKFPDTEYSTVSINYFI